MRSRLNRNCFAALALLVGGFLATGFVVSTAATAGGDDHGTHAKSPDLAAMPEVSAVSPVDFPGIHNLVAFHDGFVSGSAPEGDAGLDSLAKLGFKTVISVDGAIPDVEGARKQGLRYVHLPIGYDGFDDVRRAELVRAVRDLPKPIYIHCHHGKHRSAGAAGTIAVSLGWMSNAAAADRMKISQTAESYTGLWACTAKAAPMMAAAIDAARAEFPEITKPESMVAAMVAIDEAFDRLKLVEKNGWKVPADHPDLAPAADAGKLADLLRLLVDDAHLKSLDEASRQDFAALLVDGAAKSSALEEALLQVKNVQLKIGAASKSGSQSATSSGAAGAAASGTAGGASGGTAGAASGTAGSASVGETALTDEERARLKSAMAAVGANCKACHVKYRD
jgi:protein tyrosine phosphatase (PTP) superfamily phosphohydrolase (DUF442 family)